MGVKFNYQARTKEGEIQTGIAEASSKEAALTLLQKYGFYVTYLEEVRAPFYARRVAFLRKVSQKDIVLFSRQLAIMFSSEVPLIESLRTLALQTRNPDFREIIFDISEEVEGGMALSLALARHPKIFPSFFVAMVQSGESAGKLSESFKYLAEHLERDYNLINRIKGAMIYPALIVFAALAILFLVTFFVVPSLTEVLAETGAELPAITKIVISFTQLLRKWAWLLVLGLILFFFLLQRYYKTEEGKKLFDKIVLKLPIIGPFLKTVYITRFAENLSTLISAGIPISQSLEIVARILGNAVYKEAVFRASEEVKKGEPISSILNRFSEAFPPIFIQMTVVGEKTGTLGKILLHLVDFYQKEIDRDIENLLSILEPLLIVFLGVVVGGLIASVLLPLYQMPLG